MKNKKSSLPAQAGFLKIIIIIVIALLLMYYYGVSVEDALNWIKSFAYSVIEFFKK